MYIVQIASEIAPVAKVGGLADVMMGLNRELKRKGHKVEVLLPKYDCLDSKNLDFDLRQSGVRSFFEDAWHENTIWHTHINHDQSLTLLQSHHPSLFYDRGCIYGCHDDIDRFLYFSRAVLDWLSLQSETPDIIHVHDWETAAITFLIRQGPFKKRFEKTRTVLTIHNIAYQGQCSVADLNKVGLQGAWYDAPGRLLEDFGTNLNLLKGGIVFADYTTTVSPTYSKEVLTPDGGKGLQLVLKENIGKFSGILNGIDYDYWNPETDPLIYHTFSANDLSGKLKNKVSLRDEFGLDQAHDKPLVVGISRLVQQKGVELIKHAILESHAKGYQCVILGTTPDPAIHFEFVNLAQKYAKDPDVRILLAQEESLAHKLYAASDIFLMPSLFEPCGLTQLIALKYGSIPVVRKTGGLVDTVFDVDYSGKPFEETNGFCFDHPDATGIDSALDRAVALWKSNKDLWKKLMIQAIKSDFSWANSSALYIDMYKKIIKLGYNIRHESDKSH
ncbi:MAG: glycogen synthase [Chlamydiales bacterium]|nr:glycogen synthase [Chlamydiales bacterium]